MSVEPSSAPPLVGISLQADAHFLALNRELIENEAEIYEINPETLWAEGCVENPLHPVFREIVARASRPVVGHGIPDTAPEKNDVASVRAGIGYDSALSSVRSGRSPAHSA